MIAFLKLYDWGLHNNQIEHEMSIAQDKVTRLSKMIRSHLLKSENQFHLLEELSSGVNLMIVRNEECDAKIKVLKYTPDYEKEGLEISMIKTKTIRREYVYKFTTDSILADGKSISEVERFWRGRRTNFENYYSRDKKELVGFIIEQVIRYNSEGIDFFENILKSLVA